MYELMDMFKSQFATEFREFFLRILSDMLDDGKIAGIGTHKELLKSCDAYYQIASSQLSEAELARDLNNENDGKEEA